jgi:hypothetical protein
LSVIKECTCASRKENILNLYQTKSCFFYSNPNPAAWNFTWEPVTPRSEDLAYLYIANSSHLEMRSSLDLGNRKFWDSLPINEPQINVNIHNVKQSTRDEL